MMESDSVKKCRVCHTDRYYLVRETINGKGTEYEVILSDGCVELLKELCELLMAVPSFTEVVCTTFCN